MSKKAPFSDIDINSLLNGRGLSAAHVREALAYIKASGRSMEDLRAEMENMLNAMGSEVDPDTKDFMLNIRTNMPVDYDLWIGLFCNVLGWPIEHINLDAKHLESFAFTRDASHRLIPMFATSLTYSPGDSSDKAAEDLLNSIKKHTQTALLVFKRPQVKQIDGRWFCYIGKCLQEGQWHDFLLNKEINSVMDIFAQKNLSIEYPDLRYEDADTVLARSISAYLDGWNIPNEEPSHTSILYDEVSGWGIIVFD